MDIAKRFNRIIAIYFYLQSRPIVTAQELSERYCVSLRTIYRDMKALESAGVPLISESGIGYSLVSTYKLSPISFSADESLSFAVAEKLMTENVDKTIGDHFNNALTKIRSILRSTDKENVAHLDDKVIVYNNKDFVNDIVPEALSILFDSIIRKKQIDVTYISSSSKNPIQRNIEVIGVFQKEHYWYFMAYCYFRKEVRQFRVDRIHALKLTSNNCIQKLKPLNQYLNQKIENREIHHICLRTSQLMAKYMRWDRHYYGFTEENLINEEVEMKFNFNGDLAVFARWYIIYADQSEIIESLDLKIRVKELLVNSLTRISS